MEKLLPIKALLLVFLLLSVNAKAFQVDLESSFQNKNRDFKENDLSVEKVSLAIKEIISDDKGDRLHLFLKLEAEDNFKEKNVDQFYTKYKGPMGRWNITLGRSLIPFGLLNDYDTEMLILKTQEKKTIGYRNDDGVKLSGFWKYIDYELLVSPGKWMKNEHKDDNEKMAVLKTSYKGDDFENVRVGFSFLWGEFLGVKKKLFGIDIIKYDGLFVSRNELVIGEENEKDLISLFSGIDYSAFPSVDLNVAYTHFKTTYEENAIYAGVTYNTPFYGIVFRAGNRYHFKDHTGEKKNEIFIQIYKSFSHFF